MDIFGGRCIILPTTVSEEIKGTWEDIGRVLEDE